MKSSVDKARNTRGFLGVRAKLLMAFSIIAATTIAASTLGLYSLSNIEISIRKITGDTVPSMTTAMMLSQKTGSLKSSMPLMAISSNEVTKNKLTIALQNQVEEIVKLGTQVGGITDLDGITKQLFDDLIEMSRLASHAITHSDALADDMKAVIITHSALDKQLLIDVDDLGFDLIIESEDATANNIETLDDLINNSLVKLNAALSLQSDTNNLLLSYNVVTAAQSVEIIESESAKAKVLATKIIENVEVIGDEYLDSELHSFIEQLIKMGMGVNGVYSLKRDEINGQLPVQSIELLLRESTITLDTINEKVATSIDSLYFDLVISAESLKESNSSTIPLLMDPGVSNLRLLLEYRANNNMLLGLLSEAAQTDLIEKIIPISERITALKSSMLASLSLLESLDSGAELIAGIGTMLGFAKADKGVLASRGQVLDAQMSFDVKMLEVNNLLDQLLENVTLQVDAAKISVSDASESNLQMIKLSRTLLGAFAAASLIITMLLVWLLVSRNILQRLAKVVSALQNITEGNLSDKVEVVGSDELGELARAVDIFREKAQENNSLLEEQAKAVKARHLQEQERHRLEAERLQIQEEQNTLKLQQAEREQAATVALRADTDALLEVVQAASRGDLTRQISVKGSHPTGQLGTGLDQLFGSFTEVMHQISSTANELASDSENIAKSNAMLSERTQLQAASLEETSASMQRITEVVVNNSQNAEEAESLVNTAHNKTQEVGRVVHDTVVAMNEINESSNKISEIVGVINQIAFQTNLLALNASVEAARAGQQGAGFAVVADEVRTLAARSATAAKEIGALIDDSVKKVDYGVKLVDSSGSTLSELSVSVESVITIIKEIVKDSKSQSDGIHTVNEATRLLDEMTRKNSEMVDQGVAASDSLTSQATKLKHQVGFFSIVNNAQSIDQSKVA